MTRRLSFCATYYSGAAALVVLLAPGWWKLASLGLVPALIATLLVMRPAPRHAAKSPITMGLAATSPAARPMYGSMCLDDERTLVAASGFLRGLEQLAGTTTNLPELDDEGFVPWEEDAPFSVLTEWEPSELADMGSDIDWPGTEGYERIADTMERTIVPVRADYAADLDAQDEDTQTFLAVLQIESDAYLEKVTQELTGGV